MKQTIVWEKLNSQEKLKLDVRSLSFLQWLITLLSNLCLCSCHLCSNLSRSVLLFLANGLLFKVAFESSCIDLFCRRLRSLWMEQFCWACNVTGEEIQTHSINLLCYSGFQVITITWKRDEVNKSFDFNSEMVLKGSSETNSKVFFFFKMSSSSRCFIPNLSFTLGCIVLGSNIYTEGLKSYCALCNISDTSENARILFLGKA